MKYYLTVLLCLLLCGCSAKESPEIPESTTVETAAPETIPQPAETLPPDPIRLMLNDMSLEQRVGQLFLARCDDNYALEHIGTYHLGGFVLCQWNTTNNGIVLTSVFMKLGLLVPIVLSVLCFGETPTWLQVVGFVIAVGAIILINLKKEPGSRFG